MSKRAYPTRFPGRCLCGAKVAQGVSVHWENKKIIACPDCNDELASAGPPAPPTELRVKVQYVKYAKPDGSWVIAEVLLEGCSPPSDSPISAGRPFVVVGGLGSGLGVGDVLDVFGGFEKNDKYGWQFKADRAIPAIAGTDAGVLAFLRRFPQIGQRRAEEVLRVLGGKDAVLAALEHDPAKLTQVSGITLARAQEISEAYKATSTLKDSMLFLGALDLGPATEAAILEAYGEDTKTILLEDPFQLMADIEGVGFKKADDIRGRVNRILTGQGRPAIENNDPRRLAAAALHLIQEAEREGHTWSTEMDLLALASA